MFKIKDRIILGAISGVIAAFPSRILNRYSYKKRLTDIRYNPMAAQLFLPNNKCQTPQGILNGAIINNINAVPPAVVLTYILSTTGKDYSVLKGMGVGAFFWIMIDGLVGAQILKIKSSNSIAPTVRLIDHLLYGKLCSTLITHLGDDTLFPPKKNDTLERTPLVYTGMGQIADSQKVNPNLKIENQPRNS